MLIYYVMLYIFWKLSWANNVFEENTMKVDILVYVVTTQMQENMKCARKLTKILDNYTQTKMSTYWDCRNNTWRK